MSNVTLYTGDCLDIMRTLEAGSVDAVITDPPYNVGLSYSNGDNRSDYFEWSRDWFKEAERVSPLSILFTCGIVNLGMWHNIKAPRWVLCWWKPASSKRSPVGFNNWEPVLMYGSKSTRRGVDVVRTTEQASLPVRYKKEPVAHPCPKPVEWATKLIELMTDPGATILDPFMGSGTTGVACVQTGRNFIGIEIDPGYAEIARQRIEKAQEQARQEALPL